jgi:hypothetical protein
MNSVTRNLISTGSSIITTLTWPILNPHVSVLAKLVLLAIFAMGAAMLGMGIYRRQHDNDHG